MRRNADGDARTHATFLRGSALVLGATLIWHGSNFAFNAVGAHLLGTSQYGTLAAVTALIYVVSPVFFSIQTIASRFTTTFVARGEEQRVRGLARFYSIRLGFGGLVLAGGIALGSSALARFLRIPSAAPIAILGVAFLFSTLTHLQRGVLQGSMRFERYAVSTIAEATAKIVIAVVVLAFVWRSVDAAVLAITLATAVSLLINSMLIRFLPPSPERERPVSNSYRYSLLTLSCLVLLAVLLSMDIIAAKRYLDPHTAGIFAAVSLSGKVVFFATSALAVYLFPVFSKRRDLGIDAKGTLFGAVGAVAAGSALLVTVYFAAPHLVIASLFGSGYRAAETYIGWMGIAFAAYAMAYLTAIFLLSQESSIATAILGVAVLAQALGLYTFHSTITGIIAVQTVVFTTTAAVLGGVALLGNAVAPVAPEPA